MKLTKQRLVRLIRESIGGHLSGADDFIEEVSWYQSKGIGTKISKQKMVALYNEAPITPIDSSALDNYANSYTSLIDGMTINERFNQFVDFYLAEKRSPETTRATGSAGKIEYLQALVDATIRAKIDKPINVLNVEGVGLFISGGRTRAAAAKVAGVPVGAKIITVPLDYVNNVEKAQDLHRSLQIKK